MIKKHLLKKSKYESLNVQIYNTPEFLGKAAARFVAKQLEDAIAEKNHANLLLATGASQFEFLKSLRNLNNLEWSKITTFHLDEYIGIGPNHKASFRKYLRERIIDKVQPAEAYFLKGDAPNIQKEIDHYERLLKAHPIDVACIGIGENGHLAFNDPPVADFEDPQLVKTVPLDRMSRQQQVGEGWFDKLEDVPTKALSLTIPAIMESHTVSCVVPELRKAEAVYKTLNDPISSNCPATILRNHPDAMLFLDAPSASQIT